MEINSIKSLQELDKFFIPELEDYQKIEKVWKPESKSFMIC